MKMKIPPYNVLKEMYKDVMNNETIRKLSRWIPNQLTGTNMSYYFADKEIQDAIKSEKFIRCGQTEWVKFDRINYVFRYENGKRQDMEDEAGLTVCLSKVWNIRPEVKTVSQYMEKFTENIHTFSRSDIEDAYEEGEKNGILLSEMKDNIFDDVEDEFIMP